MQSVLVIGAAGGVGSAVCRQLRQGGHRLFLAGRTPEKLQALGDELGCPTAEIDVRDSARVDRMVELAAQRLGGLTGITLCVGSVLLKSALATTDAEWTDTLNLNLTAAFYTVRAGMRALSGTGGSIVLVSSAAARVGLINHEAIAAAKAGVEGLVRAAAASGARRKVRVNAVAPGLVKTPLTAAITGNEANLKYSVALHPLGRIGSPEEVASAICWLLDPAQSWVTGQVLGVDGGLATLAVR